MGWTLGLNDDWHQAPGASRKSSKPRQEAKHFRRVHEGGKRSKLSSRQLAALRAKQLQTVEPNPGPCRWRTARAELEHMLTHLDQAVLLLRPHVEGLEVWVAGWDEDGVDVDSRHVSMGADDLAAWAHQVPLVARCLQEYLQHYAHVRIRGSELDRILVGQGWVRDLTREGVEANPGPDFCQLQSNCVKSAHMHTAQKTGPAKPGAERRVAQATSVSAGGLQLCKLPPGECPRMGAHYHETDAERAARRSWKRKSLVDQSVENGRQEAEGGKDAEGEVRGDQEEQRENPPSGADSRPSTRRNSIDTPRNPGSPVSEEPVSEDDCPVEERDYPPSGASSASSPRPSRRISLADDATPKGVQFPVGAGASPAVLAVSMRNDGGAHIGGRVYPSQCMWIALTQALTMTSPKAVTLDEIYGVAQRSPAEGAWDSAIPAHVRHLQRVTNHYRRAVSILCVIPGSAHVIDEHTRQVLLSTSTDSITSYVPENLEGVIVLWCDGKHFEWVGRIGDTALVSDVPDYDVAAAAKCARTHVKTYDVLHMRDGHWRKVIVPLKTFVQTPRVIPDESSVAWLATCAATPPHHIELDSMPDWKPDPGYTHEEHVELLAGHSSVGSTHASFWDPAGGPPVDDPDLFDPTFVPPPEPPRPWNDLPLDYYDPPSGGVGLSRWSMVRVFRRAKPAPRYAWRSFGSFIFDQVAKIVEPRRHQAHAMHDASVNGIHLYIFQQITAAEEQSFNFMWLPALKVKRNRPRDVVEIILEAGYESFTDCKYYPGLFELLVNHAETSWMGGLTREMEGLDNMPQLRTIAKGIGSKAQQAQWERNQNILSNTIHAVHNYLTIRSFMSYATISAGLRPRTVPFFQAQAASHLTQSGAACGNNAQ